LAFKVFFIFTNAINICSGSSNNQRNHNFIEERANEVNSWADNPRIASQNLNDCSYYAKVSKSSIYRWLKSYDESNGDFRSLIPGYHNPGGKNKSRIHQRILDFIYESINEIYMNKQRLTIKELRSVVILKIEEYNKFSMDKLICPPHSTFARYVSKIPEYELVTKRLGKRSAENQFSPIGNGVSVTYPLERIEIDHTPVDVALINEAGEYVGRPYLILAIDKLTRHPVGFSIGLSNGVGWPEVMECIKHIITDKNYIKDMYPFIKNEWNAFGVPKTVVVDNGLEFKNNAMKDACYQLGFVLQFCPPRVPKWKGSIERFFGTSNTGLFHTLPGTTRSNPAKLGDDENPSKYACLTFSIFLALVHIWIVDVYSQDLNKGAGGIPSKLWAVAIQEHPVAWPGNTAELAILLGRQTSRKVTRRGIELDSLTYNSIELNKLFIKFSVENSGKNESFKVKYDPNNIGYLYLYDHLIDKRWIKIPCTNFDYANNLSEWEHKEAKAYARQNLGTVDEVSLSQSKKMIRDMVENCAGYTKKHKARANKVNSSNEITTFLNNNTTNSLDKLNKTNVIDTSKSNISDIGHLIETKDIIIPKETIVCAEPSPENSIINLDSKKVKNKSAKSKKVIQKKGSNITNNAHDTEPDIDFDNLSGFGAISNFIGDRE